MKDIYPIKIAIAGIGGFAEAHHRACLSLELEGIAKVVATCDPALDNLEPLCRELQFSEREVSLHRSATSMLDFPGESIDLGIIASPIHTHIDIHRAMVDRGIPCYLEKPPTLDPKELQQMIEWDRQATISTNVGFAFVSSAAYMDLKRRIIEGAFGKLNQATLLGMAPRPRSYFQRNDWAGKLILNDKLLLDSCLGNAMAHSLNSILFFAGTRDLHHRACPLKMDAELYRANTIEGTDTIFGTAMLEDEVEFRFAATHACKPGHTILEQKLHFTEATISINASKNFEITTPDGKTETHPLYPGSLRESLLDFINLIANPSKRPSQTLQDSLGFVETDALLYISSNNIHKIFENFLEIQDETVIFPPFEDAARTFIKTGKTPYHQKLEWAAPGGMATTDQIPQLSNVVRSIQSKIQTSNNITL